MLRLCALLGVTYVVSFTATSALTAPGGFGDALERMTRLAASASIASADMRVAAGEAAGARLARSDRLSQRAASSPRPSDRTLPAVEIALGDASAQLVLRDGEGLVVFRTDPAARETQIAKGVLAPLVSLGVDADGVGAPDRIPPQPSMPAPLPARAPAPAEPLAAGCESPLGPILAKEAPELGPSWCVASL